MSKMLQAHPNYPQVKELIDKAGGDPRKAFYALAKEKGIDPNAFLKSIQNK